MVTRVTEEDMRSLASVGFPASVRARENTSAEELAEALHRVVEFPAARLERAAALALCELSRTDQLERVLRRDRSDDARRRLGYLAERLSRNPELSQAAKGRLQAMAKRLHEAEDASKPLLTFLARANPSVLRVFAERADEVNDRWNVMGDTELGEFAR